jgi:hypothetical protein
MTEATRLPADLAGALALIATLKDRADRNETARRDAVALWTRQAETARQMVADLATCKELTFKAERMAADRLALLVGASEALESVIGVAVDCQSRWSRGHELIINSAKAVLKQVKPC